VEYCLDLPSSSKGTGISKSDTFFFLTVEVSGSDYKLYSFSPEQFGRELRLNSDLRMLTVGDILSLEVSLRLLFFRITFR